MEEKQALFWIVPITVKTIIRRDYSRMYQAHSPFLVQMGAWCTTPRQAVVRLLEDNRSDEGGLFLDEDHYAGSMSAEECADLILHNWGETPAPETPPIESHLPTLE